ncbi:mechanosensitive ion channel family protein [Salibaculum griseiflavum]|uniref:Small-conductance mechanosensitive channel n=1 Tax=Salibaculum griseiflavum TaxID=1914409 RepID=A0A2V1PC30_9RHOB|nr:mechanosensitive ion channel domain-containing protein [Salibaculum griseiflavum]PWG18472.1 mechanosensitive ion channel protein MscS [Salibaculum griseiflavum]
MSEDFVIGILVNIAIALAIFVIALWLSGWIKSRIIKASETSPKFDATLARFLASVARYAILAIAVIFILGRFGIETTSLAALVGAVGLAIGFALQGSLANLAAGVMLVVFRPFKAGDYVNAGGQSGTVDEITLFTTEMTTPDNVKIIVPNGDVFSGAITNYSHYDTRRCDLVFGVSYDTDLKKAEKIITDIVTKDERVMSDPAPFVKVTNLGDSSVDFTVRAWCAASDYWDLKFHLTRAVKEAFDKQGVDIPFPTQTLIQQAG